ncbi:MAG: IclR family transcriptional regulator C-terminal domain-containing protein [Oceanospirillaceae bacterium]
MPDQIDKDFLTTFARGLEVIRSFDAASPSMTLTQVAAKNGLSRASARRFLLTLQKLGYMSCEAKNFKLTAKVLDLGYAYLSSLNFSDTLSPFLESVTHQLEESCSATVLDGQEVVYIARIPRRGLVPISLQIGARLPAFATSSGRVLLAALSEVRLEQFLQQLTFAQHTAYTLPAASLLAKIQQVRLQGFAIVDQELELGMRAVSVPVYDRSQQVRFAISISCHVSSYSIEEIEQQFVPLLQHTALQISDALS